MSFYSNLTPEEMTRIQPFIRAKCVIMTRDSPPVESISAIHDISEERPRHLEISTTSGKSKDADMTDAIELQTKEPTKNGHNGVNHQFKDYHQDKDNECCVKCVYFAQQCCECVIV
uniref:Jarid2b protein n=1 Tax=Fopius arisanus TaxID=64838 RepID=A0A0C9R9R6_9HYME